MSEGMKCRTFVLLSALWSFPVVQVVEFDSLERSTLTVVTVGNENDTATPTTIFLPTEGVQQAAERFERQLKGFIKDGVKLVMSKILSAGVHGPRISPKCAKAFMKFIADLTKARMWALKMLDASSKIPAGVLEGTFTDYGSYDECLGITVPLRNGNEDFRGRFCVIETSPRLPPIPRNYSFARQPRTKPLDTMAKQFIISSSSFEYLKYRFGICVPSSCSIEDIGNITVTVLNPARTNIDVAKCYVKERVKFRPIHIAVICVLAALMLLSIAGTVVEFSETETRTLDSGVCRVLLAFSLTNNLRLLMAPSNSNTELRALHAVRALSMAWLLLGHTYVWLNFGLASSPMNSQAWFNSFEFEPILNGWLSVETFFFLSGLLTCYIVLQETEKSKSLLKIPMFIIHRYLRLTPPLLLTMGLLFLLPLISSGPFWYDRMDSELENCRNHWWTNLVYTSNLMSIDKICVQTTWYLAADFQMFIVSLLFLLLFCRSSSFSGMIALGLLTVTCNIVLFALTYVFELPPAMLISTVNSPRIKEQFETIHVRTFTHSGPYYIGMVTGYLILKNKENLHFTKWQNILGWCASVTLSVSSVYGLHKWNTGYFHGPLLTSFYAAMHRTTFALGVSWVIIACVAGNSGPVNWILSRKLWIPFSKLTYSIYLLHGLVFWTRLSSRRERFYLSHYNMIYEYISNLVIAVVVSTPFYLLVEAPMSNLQRIIFPRPHSSKQDLVKKDSKHAEGVTSFSTSRTDLTRNVVQLTSVNHIHSGEIQNGFKHHIPIGLKIK